MLTNFRADRRVGARSRRRGSAFEGRSAHAPALDQRRAARGHGDGRDGRPVGAAGAGQRDGRVRDRRGRGVGHRGVRRAGGVPAGRGGARGRAGPHGHLRLRRRRGLRGRAALRRQRRHLRRADGCRRWSSEVAAAVRDERPVAYLTTIGGEVTGNPRVVGGEGEPADEAEAAARPLLEMGESGVVTVGGDEVFVSSFVPAAGDVRLRRDRLRLGAVHRRQVPRLPRHRLRPAGDLRDPRALPGRRRARHGVAARVPGDRPGGRAHRHLRADPRRQVRRARPEGRAGHARPLHRRDGQPRAPPSAGARSCSRRAWARSSSRASTRPSACRSRRARPEEVAIAIGAEIVSVANRASRKEGVEARTRVRGPGLAGPDPRAAARRRAGGALHARAPSCWRSWTSDTWKSELAIKLGPVGMQFLADVKLLEPRRRGARPSSWA